MATIVFWVLLSCVAFLLMLTKLLPRGFRLRETNEDDELVRAEKTPVGGSTRIREKRNKLCDKDKKILRGPQRLPLIGSLHLLRGSGGPFEAFTNLARQYGDIYEIQLGVANCVVVSSFAFIKEVLITKGNHFGGRPDFLRFHQLFGGDRNNCEYNLSTSFQFPIRFRFAFLFRGRKIVYFCYLNAHAFLTKSLIRSEFWYFAIR